MKKTVKMIGASVLIMGIALAVSLGTTRMGTAISDPEVLTKITGAACGKLDTQSCMLNLACDTCGAYGGGTAAKCNLGADIDCSSAEGWACGACKKVVKCSGGA